LFLYLGNVDIPDDFFDFVTSFKNKFCHFYDKESRYYTLRLKDIINNGMRAVIAFKKELGLGQKVVKFHNGTKKEMKNYIYNWAYFYICFSISSKNVYLMCETF
jgi:predicted PolB exonuclease-like 3'-5' exonuclease